MMKIATALLFLSMLVQPALAGPCRLESPEELTSTFLASYKLKTGEGKVRPIAALPAEMAELRAKIKSLGLDGALHDAELGDKVFDVGMNAEGPDVGRLCATGREQASYVHDYVIMLCGTYELGTRHTSYKLVVRNTDGYTQDILALGSAIPKLDSAFRRRVLKAVKRLALNGLTCRDKIEDTGGVKRSTVDQPDRPPAVGHEAPPTSAE